MPARQPLSAAQKKEFDKVVAMVVQGAPLGDVRAEWVDALRRLGDVDAWTAAAHVVSEAQSSSLRQIEQVRKQAELIEAYYYPLNDEVRWIIARYREAIARARAGMPWQSPPRYKVVASPGDLSWRLVIERRPFESVEELTHSIQALEGLVAEAASLNKAGQGDIDEAIAKHNRINQSLASLPAFLLEPATPAVRKGP